MNTIQAEAGAPEQALTNSGKVDAYAFAVKWRKVRRATRRQTLQSINKRLSASWTDVVKSAEANTRRLTGRSRF